MLDGIDFSKINLSDMMGQIQQIATKVKEDGANQIFTSKVGGGMIELSINGNSEVVDLQIDGFRLDIPNEVPFWFWEIFRNKELQIFFSY